MSDHRPKSVAVSNGSYGVRALWLARDTSQCERLASCLPPGTQIVPATLDDARDLAVHCNPNTMVFADIQDADAIFESCLSANSHEERCERLSRAPFIFLTGNTPPGDYFGSVVQHGIQWFLHPSFLNNDRLMGSIFQSALRESLAKGLECIPSSEPVIRQVLSNVSARSEMIDAVTQRVAERFVGDFDEMEHRLALEEILNNALFHAFKNENNTPKYSVMVDQQVFEPDQVILEHLVDDDLFAFCVTDTGGGLTGEAIRRDIHRQITREGVLQERGRGVFLTFSFANVFIVNSIPGRLSQVLIVFLRHSPADQKLFHTHLTAAESA